MRNASDIKPFIFLNAAMTADAKIAPASGHYKPFGSRRDQEHLMELRASADAVVAGARTVDTFPVNMGPGSVKYRRRRLRRGLSEYNLRVIVSGAGTVDVRAEIFRHRFSPIIVLTTERITKAQLRHLSVVADDVKAFGHTTLDLAAATRWLASKWGVKRLLCEGGGQLNAALFAADLVDEVHLTVCPILFGGRDAPTLADGTGVKLLSQATRMRLISLKKVGDEHFLVYGRNGASSRL